MPTARGRNDVNEMWWGLLTARAWELETRAELSLDIFRICVGGARDDAVDACVCECKRAAGAPGRLLARPGGAVMELIYIFRFTVAWGGRHSDASISMGGRSGRGTAGVWLPCDGGCRKSRGFQVARLNQVEIVHVVVSAHLLPLPTDPIEAHPHTLSA